MGVNVCSSVDGCGVVVSRCGVVEWVDVHYVHWYV